MYRQWLLSCLFLLGSISAWPLATDSQFKFHNEEKLRFTREGTFQIAVLEDLHYGEAEDLDWGPQQDVSTENVINSVLDAESPQLVVLNGDLITGENTYLSNSSSYLDIIVRPLVQRGLTWASTYGNHDAQNNLSAEALLARERRYPNSRTENMVSSPNARAGITNYYLPVFSSDATVKSPLLLLWFFDSRGGKQFQSHDPSGNEIPVPGYVDEAVVAWFLEKSENLRRHWRRAIPSLAFVHIPVNAMAAFQTQGVDAQREPGINDDDPLAQQGLQEGKYVGSDVPFMQALLQTKGLVGVFSGHDHGDDWCFKWDSKLPGMDLAGNGMFICFGRHTGYGGYGNWMRGSRQILLREETLGKETETWVRMEDGSSSARVMLNETYGKDLYPVVSDKYTF